MVPDIPSTLLRSFVCVVDCGSLSAASRRVGRSESALSLQMARLEGILGRALFDRDGRALKLNETGQRLLPHARAILSRIDAARSELGQDAGPPIRLGIVQDFVTTVLRPTLADLRASAGERHLSIMIATSGELLQALGEDRIDTALCAGEPIGGTVVRTFPMRWFGNRDLLSGDVVPLVGITPPCPFLTAAQACLDREGIAWRMAMITPSLDGLRAAVEAGIGLSCRTETGLALPPLTDPALPPLPSITYSVFSRRHEREKHGSVALLLGKYLSQLGDPK
ncbi:MAG: LysR family transcriptional regulator [Neomegalonema sp.]|nr:LysR family transcriptional regulator [Neomegalonema sp.]